MSDLRAHVRACGVCFGGEIARMRRGNPHWSWLNAHFRARRAVFKADHEAENT
jgi:hypothetical protein